MTSTQPDGTITGSVTGSVTGLLYIVGTPIGNLGDLSSRAVEVLASVDAVICEDSRRTGRLLAHLGIGDRGERRRPALLIANEHTEVPLLEEITERLETGQRLALVTDAGMPSISDPGEHVVRAAVDGGHRVEVIPGPTALSSALALSGLPARRFVFEGFLPRKGRERTERLAEIADERRTIVLYEAPHRLLSTLRHLGGVCGDDRSAVVARELTKLHEEVVRGTLSDLVAHFETTEPRGEFVLVVTGRPTVSTVLTDDDLVVVLKRALDRGLSRRDAVVEVVAETGEPKRRVYGLANDL